MLAFEVCPYVAKVSGNNVLVYEFFPLLEFLLNTTKDRLLVFMIWLELFFRFQFYFIFYSISSMETARQRKCNCWVVGTEGCLPLGTMVYMCACVCVHDGYRGKGKWDIINQKVGGDKAMGNVGVMGPSLQPYERVGFLGQSSQTRFGYY